MSRIINVDDDSAKKVKEAPTLNKFGPRLVSRAAGGCCMRAITKALISAVAFSIPMSLTANAQEEGGDDGPILTIPEALGAGSPALAGAMVVLSPSSTASSSQSECVGTANCNQGFPSTPPPPPPLPPAPPAPPGYLPQTQSGPQFEPD